MTEAALPRRPRLAPRGILVAFLLLGAGLRLMDVARPVDGTIQESWRESDMAAVARNFDREGMNILYPRIDWRGTGPGFAEMEFPLYPWLIAASYRVVGFDERIGRYWSAGFAILTLLVVTALARRLLEPWGAVAATAFFALSPLPVHVAATLQPEALMLLAYAGAMYAFHRWREARSWRWAVATGLAAALAILSKATAAHLGLAMLILLVLERRRGWLADPQSWAIAALALVPAAAWYWHAHSLWLSYGNSLGVSNESHLIGLDIVRPATLLAIARLDLEYVWMPAGVVLGLAGIGLGWGRHAATTAACWLLSVGAFYLIAARTTGDRWAAYYHVVAAVPASLLVGLGVERLLDAARTRVVARGWVAYAVLAVAATVTTGSLAASVWRHRPTGSMAPLYRCAIAWREVVPVGTTILASGGVCADPTGRPVAYNASYLFYWMDRRGFNVCVGEQSIERVREFAARGAGYFAAEKQAVRQAPGFEQVLLETFPLVAECGRAYLFRIADLSGASLSSDDRLTVRPWLGLQTAAGCR